MTSQTSTRTIAGWRRTVTSLVAATVMAVGMMFGFGSATARADIITDLVQEFSTAAGAGQVANLLNQSLQLSGKGFRPTRGQLSAIEEANGYRPNQTPLVRALQDTVDGQTRALQLAQAGQENPYTIGINQYDPDNPDNGGVTVGEGGINIGGGGYTIGNGRR